MNDFFKIYFPIEWFAVAIQAKFYFILRTTLNQKTFVFVWKAIKEEWRRQNQLKFLGRCRFCLRLSYASLWVHVALPFPDIELWNDIDFMKNFRWEDNKRRNKIWWENFFFPSRKSFSSPCIIDKNHLGWVCYGHYILFLQCRTCFIRYIFAKTTLQER